jgi:anti-anti-sigma factor
MPYFTPGDRVRLRVPLPTPSFIGPGSIGEVVGSSSIADATLVTVTFEDPAGERAEYHVFERDLELVEALDVVDFDAEPEPRLTFEPLLVTRRDDVSIFTLEGDYDISAAPMLRERLATELGAAKACLVDLRRATFIDSSIVGVLLDARGRARETGVAVAIVLDDDTSAPVRRLLEVANVLLLFHEFADLTSAVAATRPGAPPDGPT